MPPLYARRDSVPDILVPLTPDLQRHYWELFVSLRELAIVRQDYDAAMECNRRLNELLDYPCG